jgi:DNA (cytosine-5)-methyltransferase 1
MIEKFTVISLFTGAYGLDLGLEKAGFEVKACVEKDPIAVQTILANRPSLEGHIIQKDINDVALEEILEAAKLKKGEVTLVSGGPPCQPFSTVGSRRSVSTAEGMLFKKFLDIVWGIQPEFFIFENVKGIMSSAIQHRPISKRTSRHSSLSKIEHLGSAWDFICKSFDQKLRRGKKYGYNIFVWELNAADFGTAQERKRVFVVGAKGLCALDKPKGKFIDKRQSIKTVIGNLDGKYEKERIDFLPYDKLRYEIFSEGMIKEGQNWKTLPIKLQKKAMGKGWYATGGKVGFCRRLSWDKPSPTITTNPAGRATNLCHPDKPRPLTYQECALIQGFPLTWKFAGSLTHKYRQIGNAVPVKLARSVGKAIVRSLEGKKNG